MEGRIFELEHDGLSFKNTIPTPDLSSQSIGIETFVHVAVGYVNQRFGAGRTLLLPG